ncbi:tRNA (guanosine(37)-N1)-methyltransferase TrmD [Candidatus Dojkabacteria bacterium]|uniref:tRNA (guanine-N(1)-)-methyltransferase n=1 Tax=Candidatus Dojkabacteria bacterium TaxID=2099670 RepID=A0A3M0YXX9_9BACT|nr:MAG: tRNA (guanosine(37)-N1)-methyltransferase TrmD [Candidatus Dojkabacteria bacterium]
MRFDILTIFPTAFSYLNKGIIDKAQKKGKLDINIWDIREFSKDKHKKVDDKPYGGGVGMILKVQPIHDCLVSIGVFPKRDEKTAIVLMQPGGEIWTQQKATEFRNKFNRIVIICGHYQGVDGRVSEYLVDYEISIGEYVLSGGELPAMVLVDSISRLVDGVLGNKLSISGEPYLNNIVKSAPIYTTPRNFLLANGLVCSVPEVLLSGHHKNIENWKRSNTQNSNNTSVQNLDKTD